MGVLKTIEDLAKHLGGALDDVIAIGEKKKTAGIVQSQKDLDSGVIDQRFKVSSFSG